MAILIKTTAKKKMTRKNKLITLLLSIVGFVFGQTPTVLSFNTFLNNISSNHPLLNRADNLIKGAEYYLKAKRGEYDPMLSGNYENKFFDSKNYYSVLSSEIKQPIFTSQYLKAGYEYGDGVYLNPEEKTASYGLPFLGMEASLLQGMFIDKRRADVLKAKEYVSLSQAERNEITNNVLYEALYNYAEWSFINKQLSVYDYFIRIAQLRNNGIVSLANSGEKPAIDTVEASILYQTRLLELQSLKIELQRKNADIVSFNWLEGKKSSPHNSNFIPDSLDYLFDKMKSSLLRELDNDSLNNPVISQYIAKEKILNIDVRLKKEMVKPKLDVKYNFLSASTNPNNPQFNSNNYKWGASLSMPLFLRSSRNELKLAKVNANNIGMELESKNNELTNKINYVKQSLNILTNQLINATRNALFSKKLLEAEKLKFDNGESSLFLLNTRENNWLQSEIKLAEYKLKFIKTVLQVIHLKGTLKYSI